MKLCYSPTSPYVRKVHMTAIIKGLESEVEIVPSPTGDPDSPLWQDNPLGKVPALTTREGLVLCDSPLICEYLDSLCEKPVLIPKQGDKRWRSLNQEALADGLLDAAVARVMEKRLRPPKLQWAGLHRNQYLKVARTLAVLEKEAESGMLFETLDIGGIAVACALGYLDFRFDDEDWRKDCPALAAWFAKIAKHPAFVKSAPPKAA